MYPLDKITGDTDQSKQLSELCNEMLDLQEQVKRIEEQLKKKAGDAILDTSDNVFSAKELKKIRIIGISDLLGEAIKRISDCLLYTSPSPRD